MHFPFCFRSGNGKIPGCIRILLSIHIVFKEIFLRITLGVDFIHDIRAVRIHRDPVTLRCFGLFQIILRFHFQILKPQDSIFSTGRFLQFLLALLVFIEGKFCPFQYFCMIIDLVDDQLIGG